MKAAALLAVLLLAPASVLAEDSTEPLTRVGAGFGLVVAPTFSSVAPIFLGGLAVLEIDVHGQGPLGFNLAAQFGGGFVPVNNSSLPGGVTFRSSVYGLGAFLLTPELRLHFTPRFASGIGVTLGPVFAGTGAAFWLGPSVTLLAARFAVHHEVTVGLAPLFQLTGNTGFATLLPTLRYTYLF